MSKETPKQKLRRLLDRLDIDAEKKREADRFIEEMDDEDAESFVDAIEEMEADVPGTIDAAIQDINANGIPED